MVCTQKHNNCKIITFTKEGEASSSSLRASGQYAHDEGEAAEEDGGEDDGITIDDSVRRFYEHTSSVYCVSLF